MHHASTYTESAECIGKLIESGSQIDQEDSQKWTPLHWAAKSGSAAVASQLLKAGASKRKVDASGRTAVQIAMCCGNVHLRPLLFIDNGAGIVAEAVGEKHKDVLCDICDMVSSEATEPRRILSLY